METYTFLRQLADSWVLLALTLFFLGVIVFNEKPIYPIIVHIIVLKESIVVVKGIIHQIWIELSQHESLLWIHTRC